MFRLATYIIILYEFCLAHLVGGLFARKKQDWKKEEYKNILRTEINCIQFTTGHPVAYLMSTIRNIWDGKQGMYAQWIQIQSLTTIHSSWRYFTGLPYRNIFPL